MSILWKFFTGKQEPWYEACIEHDLAYYHGGTYKERKIADQKLRESVEKTGHPIWALIMYIAVRIGGSACWPLPWRWGFKYDWFTEYFE